MQSTASFLPSDEVIFRRSMQWADFLSNAARLEDHNEIYYEDLPSISDPEDDSEDESDSDNTCGTHMEASEFEATTSSCEDDDFNVNELLNDILPEVEERKRRWRESGMDRVLDSFDLNAIAYNVGGWLRKSRMQNQAAGGNEPIEDTEMISEHDWECLQEQTR